MADGIAIFWLMLLPIFVIFILVADGITTILLADVIANVDG